MKSLKENVESVIVPHL